MRLKIIYTFIQYVHPVFATSVTYIIPIFAVMWGVIGGEQIVLLQVLFIGAILAGVYPVTRNNNKKRKI